MGKFYTIFLLAASLLTGCCSKESEPEGDVIAQIGDSKLYREDVQRFIPATSTGEDSVNFTRRYINSWALNKLLVIEAQRRLSKEERDVAALVEEYKNQLLIYRLENRYIEQQLDTLVTRDEQESYYKSRQDEFKTKEGLEELKNKIKEISYNFSLDDTEFVTNNRQQDCLKKCRESLVQALVAAKEHQLQDLISIDLKSALLFLDEITGEVITDDILNNIFDHFCIGK